jgi:hypothetical protein
MTRPAPGWLKKQCAQTKHELDAATAWAKQTLEDHNAAPCDCGECCAARIVLLVLR